MQVPKNHPNTGHQSPYWYSDSKKGIRDHRRSVPRGRRCFKDLNLQPLLDDDGFIHWATAAKNGYLYIKIGKFKRRELTFKEKHQVLKYWPAEDFVKLRRTEKIGLSYASRVRPMLYREGIKYCKRHRTIPCVEIKSPYGISVRAKRLVDTAVALKWEPIFMALFKMLGIYQKSEAIIQAGGKFVILAHGEKRPNNLPPHTEIWGHFRK